MHLHLRDTLRGAWRTLLPDARRATLVALTAAALHPARLTAQVLDSRAIFARNGWLDNRDWSWYAQHIPLFESPDATIDSTYYYRWELVTKHLTYGDPATGYTFSEFIDHPFWSGAYGAISCPLGHQFYEVRWLNDPRIVDDFARYWFEAPGAQPRSYSNWYGDAMWATYLVRGDRAFIAHALPYMKRQFAGWEAEHYDPSVGLFHWDGLHDGMERSINSRQTDDIDTGADGYRPTLNSYMFADARAIARASALLGDTAAARAYAARADTIRAHVEHELWDERRQFFMHEFAHDDKDGIRARTHTYDSGKYAGNPHGRELIGYVPWQFELPEPGHGYENAWRFLMDTAYFAAPYGPTTAERHDPLFHVSPTCCWWSGNSWPYATTQTLVALANVLDDYKQELVTKRDYFTLLETYTRTQRRNGRPYIAEAANPDDGSWEGHNTFQHSEDYFHSGYVDLIITGLVGLRPRADDSLEVNPLAPDDWPYFALDGVEYHGHRVSIRWDRDGTHYGHGQGLALLADGRVIASAPALGRLVAPLGPVPAVEDASGRSASMVNLAVNNGRGAYPSVTATYSAPTTPSFLLIDGNYRYTTTPPNRWTDSGSVRGRESLVLDFGVVRPLEQLTLYFLDDGEGSAIRAPKLYDVELWENGRWTNAPIRARYPAAPEGHRANTVAFSRRVESSGVRVTLTHRPGAYTGLTELEAWAHAALPLAPATALSPDLAFNASGSGYPRLSASFTGANDRVQEAADARIAFSRYSRNRWTVYGTPNARDWLAVDFGAPRTVRTVEIYLWGDDRGVRAPRRYTVQYWNGVRWADARVRSRLPERPTAGAVNTVRLAPLRTTKLRIVFEHDLPAATGVTELVIAGDR